MSEEAPKVQGERTRRRRRHRREEGAAEPGAVAALPDAPPAEPKAVLPEETLSPFARQAREGLRELLARMGMVVDVGVIAEDEEQLLLDVAGSDAQHLVGKKGQVLDAVQMMVNKIVKRQAPGPLIVVDAEGYRDRRTESLVALAHRVMEEALASRRVVALNPMSARDRRIIHMTLRDAAGVTTRSEGEGDERRLLVVPEP